MGNCGSNLHCNFSGPYGYGARYAPSQTNPDITGPGAIVAFITPALLSVFILLAGYFLAKLPSHCTNALDETMTWDLHNLGASFLPRKSREHAASKDVSEQEVFKRQEKVIFGLEQFVLALSDSQLVTGLAILIGTYANTCNITVHEFQMATSLAWLSTTTHLASLQVYQHYFNEHPQAMLVRLVIMTLNLVSLSLALFICFFLRFWDQLLSIQCFFLYHGLMSTFYWDVVSTITGILVLWAFFIQRVYGLVIRRRKENSKQLSVKIDTNEMSAVTSSAEVTTSARVETEVGPVRFACFKVFFRTAQSKYLLDNDDFVRHLDAAVANKREKERNQLDILLADGFKLRHYFKKPMMRHLWRLWQTSFAGQVPFLIWIVCYGLTRILIIKFWSGVEDDAQEITSFGQLVPTILLLLPALVAVEALFAESTPPVHSSPLLSDEQMSIASDADSLGTGNVRNTAVRVDTPDESFAQSARQSLSEVADYHELQLHPSLSHDRKFRATTAALFWLANMLAVGLGIIFNLGFSRPWQEPMLVVSIFKVLFGWTGLLIALFYYVFRIFNWALGGKNLYKEFVEVCKTQRIPEMDSSATDEIEEETA